MAADPIDDANDLMLRETEHAVAAARRATAVELRRTGRCHNCEEPLGGDALFCDADCRLDWEKRTRAEARR